MTSQPTDSTAPILNADELLAPLATPAPTPVDIDPDHRAVADAISAGTIPTFPDEPESDAVTVQPPVDPEAERAALKALIAFINTHKDDGTLVTFADPDAIH